ncbi:MAG: Fis family transcriptional regulator [Nitrospirae bacterium GWC2_57_13]|nr:MAG: Fis family transcriptional regulator [Nitrospirae bacterium GWC2_57_13]OGW43973.1 MAG: Fis family transcriptional regulator [Nitrospirae bacterium GWD2_57_8]HAS55644.1 Fis family transcriptional regulator [Nitrospiraceae bacterium]
MNKILVVDDEKSMRDFLSIMLRKTGYDVSIAENGEEALARMQSEIFDLVISDVKMPDIDGIAVLKQVKDISPETIVIMITAFATTETAIEAMKLGAYDYITKPFKVDEIKLIIQKALERHHLKKENILLRREMESRAGFDNFIGKSEAMKKIFSLIRQVADTKSTVLISGESGTGKELVARAIHFSSSRKERPFVTINCGALPETLLESELFGSMKGAFTGAVANRQGLFESANGGTIFLDEISATTPALQIKLLRVLQEREFKRVGGTADIKVDVRVISASNRDLLAEVSRGAFREDLYYRLNVIPIQIPPLRERRDDIPLLTGFFLLKYASEEVNASGDRCKVQKQIAPESLRLLMNYNWPGNVRELENTIERLAILSSGSMILPEHIFDAIPSEQPSPDAVSAEIPEEGLDLEKLLEQVEKTLLYRALERAKGVKTEAAKLLRLTFRSFRHRLQKYETKQ